MNKKQILRMAVDLAMTAILLLLMGYSRVGEAAHEWLGVGMLVLFVLHHILNRSWIKRIFRGPYSPYRILQTALVLLILLTMLGSAVSGVMLSGRVFAFLRISGGTAFARTLHMLCGYWNLVLLSLHLGLHWIMVVSMVSKNRPKKPALTWLARVLGLALAGYGVYSMLARQVPEYLFGSVGFAFFDLDEPLVFFLLDYLAIMGLFVFAGHYLALLCKKLGRKHK